MTVTSLDAESARQFLVGHHQLRQALAGPPHAAVQQLLRERRCIQLDPLDVLGTNADLVALARIDGLSRGDVYRHLMPGHAFEHFAKERCLLPASAFPYYRGQAAETDWWGHAERLRRVPEKTISKILAAVRAHGPLTVTDLEQHGEWGKVDPLDWSGWKGTARAAQMALEVLWTRCEVVVSGRSGKQKLWDTPARALGAWGKKAKKTPAAFRRWALLERVEAAGLLSTSAGPQWSMLAKVRTSSLPAELVAEGLLEEVRVAGASRTYLAPAGFRERSFPSDDGRMRILGPLDSCIWDRKLVAHVFGFDYVWEVYKPPATRQYGWYVCPLMHDGRLVGRFEARAVDGVLRVDNLWPEARGPGRAFDKKAFRVTLERHARALDMGGIKVPK